MEARAPEPTPATSEDQMYAASRGGEDVYLVGRNEVVLVIAMAGDSKRTRRQTR
jgi:hypothetical protein